MTPRRFARLNATLDRRQPDLTVLAENVHKPHNLSAIVRTCDAVGIGEIHAVADDEVPFYHLTSGGSRKYVSIRTHSDIAAACAALRNRGMRVLAAHFSDCAIDFRRVDYTRPTALLLGAELDGVTQAAADAADDHVTIPMFGMVSSLNVSVAAAVILYEAQRQRASAGLYDRRRTDRDTAQRLLFEWSYPEVAELCRQKGEPYPPLDGDGYIVGSPDT